MHLTIDIGNTSVKFALFEGKELSYRGAGIEQLSSCLADRPAVISAAIISSVADQGPIPDLLNKFNIPYSILSHRTPLPIQNLYHTPDTLGSDRLALAVAAYSIFGDSPVLAIGAGTSIIYNFIDQGRFMGGGISPGITMRFQALHHYTAKLPLIDWASYREQAYNELTGSDSSSSILSGVLNGVLHEIDGTIEQYRARYSGLQVAVTGGDIDFLVKNLKNDIFARPYMVLEGLNYILLQHA